MPLAEWENRHQSFKQSLRAGASYKLHNPDLPKLWDRYMATVGNFQWLIGQAVDNGYPLRALGRGWSFSKVGVCDGGIVDTMALTLSFNMTPALTHPDYLGHGDVHDLFMAQCGLGIELLDRKLEEESSPKRCICASGAANGQSIVGAASTNTHGAAYRYGAVHDQIIGLHLVTGRDKHVWVERASCPVVSDAFMQLLGAELVRDDDLFDSAVVGFGSFGFVAGVMLQVQPIMLLEEYKRKNIPYNAATRHALNTLDLESIKDHMPGPFNTSGYEPYHFEVGFNPHQFGEDDPERGLFMRVMYRTAYREDYPRMQARPGFGYGDNTFEVLQQVLDGLGHRGERGIPLLVNELYPMAYEEGDARVGTMGEHFNSTRVRGNAASLAIGVDVANTSRTIDTVIALNKERPFAGVTAIRFVKGTKAKLGFTRFPITCVLELDGFDSKGTGAFYELMLERLEHAGITYTLHWGKINHMMNADRLRNMYPQASIDTWVRARTRLLEPAVMNVFTNEFMRNCGLDRAAVIA